MAEIRNANQNRSSSGWEVVYKISIVVLLLGLVATQIVIAVSGAINASYMKKFYDLFESNDFFWNIQWSNGRVLHINTQSTDVVRFQAVS
ncbi:hypothetical protein CPB86DRAFT_319849 [Serendipita vermifera]|nr:hypothetical protein CPB86DRAFT_319849 [Serendipita vermifera]